MVPTVKLSKCCYLRLIHDQLWLQTTSGLFGGTIHKTEVLLPGKTFRSIVLAALTPKQLPTEFSKYSRSFYGRIIGVGAEVDGATVRHTKYRVASIVIYRYLRLEIENNNCVDISTDSIHLMWLEKPQLLKILAFLEANPDAE